MVFQQLFESQTSTYTYLLACERTREALLIDPVLEMLARDLKLIDELGLKLLYVLDTHIHADHITAAGEIRKARPGVRTAVSGRSGVECADLSLADGENIRVGDLRLRVLQTPGHTDSCVAYSMDDRVFTGDTLLIRGCGRTDFQQGSSDLLYESVHQKLFTLPDAVLVYPGHDYKGFTSSTIGDEKRLNPRLGGGRTKDQFRQIMSELKLADPARIKESVPANLGCGIKS